jgi:FkbM family methyltransferase
VRFFWKKLQLAGFLCRRVPRHGMRQLIRGISDRRTGYLAMELAHVLPKHAEVVIDVGAHHGDFAAALDLLYAPESLWLIEANPALAPKLAARFSGEKNTRVFSCCLGDREATVAFNVHSFDAASSLYRCKPGHLEELGLDGQSQEVKVPMTTLSALLAKSELSHIDLLKLDCQGAELDVLRGAETHLSKVGLIFCEVSFEPVYEGAPLFHQVHDYLRNAGFALVGLSGLSGNEGGAQWADALYRNTRSS